MNRCQTHILRGALALLTLVIQGHALSPQGTSSDSPSETPPATTVFSHPEQSPWWISGQINLIGQAHGF